MREELIDYLKGLADPEYQQRVWVQGLPDPTIEHDELDFTIHFLYDDTHLAEDLYLTIGSILHNDKEAEAVKRLIASLEVIFSKYGLDLDDSDYIKLPEWTSVVECAKTALHDIR